MMKSVTGLVLCISAALVSANAQAMVRVMNLSCGPMVYQGSDAPQANAPRFNLSCGITSSFGPTEVNCAVQEAVIFPHAEQESIELQQVPSQSAPYLYFRGADGIEVVLDMGNCATRAMIYYGALQSECQ